MSNWDFNSINSLFQQNQEKSQVYGQGSLIQLNSPEPINLPDRQSTIGFSHVFERTINFNDIERHNQPNSPAKTFNFTLALQKEQENVKLPSPIFEPSKDQISREIILPQNLKTLSGKVFQVLRENSSISYKDIMTVLIQSFTKQSTTPYYDPDKKQENNQIKNLRRRLYDTINVLFAAKIIQKDAHSFALKRNCVLKEKKEKPSKKGRNAMVKEQKSVSDGKQQLVQGELEIINLKRQMAIRQRKLQKTRRNYSSLLSKYVILKKLVSRNINSQRSINTQLPEKQNEANYITFPTSFILIGDKNQVEITSQKVIVRFDQEANGNKTSVNLTSDWDALGYLFLTDTMEMQQAKNQLLSESNATKVQQQMDQQYPGIDLMSPIHPPEHF